MRKNLSIPLIILIILAGSCSTEKNTPISRSYHNLTSHYNIYFNGNESFKKGVDKAEKSLQDNYTLILPVFYYSNPAVAQIVAPDMNRALEKATKVISLHSITAKPELKKGPQSQKQKDFYNRKEFNKWIDDNYLLIGKSYVYKNEFYFALETFRKIITDYPADPIRFEAMIWMASAYSELKEYREAERILRSLADNPEVPDSYHTQLFLTWSDYYIKQKNYEQAIPWMEKAVEGENRKLRRIRYNFILAQLYQETKNSVRAVETYRKVIKMNPPYEMTFNAKINMARSFEKGTGDGREISSLLGKMLKDEKNIEFQDQIYFALGQIALKENNGKEALELLEKSIRTSVNNTNQKGLTFLTMADIYYLRPDYAMAQAYYDSAMQNIDQTYPDYTQLNLKTRSLTHLVEHLLVYQLEDSVQELAGMSEAARFEIIDAIINEINEKEAEERKRQQEESLDTQYGLNLVNDRLSQNTPQMGGQWYFYNFNAKSFGQPEFRLYWGNRRLEDNWRRKNKQSNEFAFAQEDNAEAASDSSGQVVVLSNKTREYYLKNIPLTDSAMAISHSRIEKALFNMGIIYRDEMKDDQESAQAFKEQITRYPDGQNALIAYYSLYNLYNTKGDASNANIYKSAIIQKFPESSTARLLSDPSYAANLEKELARIEDTYQRVYDNYNSGAYSEAITLAEQAIRNWPDDRSIPRFRLLKALSVGKLHGNEMLKTELEALQTDFPGHEISTYAGSIIALIYNVQPDLKLADEQEKAEEIYIAPGNEFHYFGIACFPGADVNQLNFNLINFNLDNFNRLNLAILTEYAGDLALLLVQPFADTTAAQNYLNVFMNKAETVLNNYPEDKAQVFLISKQNLETLKNDKNFERYSLFYRKFYLKE